MLSGRMEEVDLPGGNYLFRQGDEGDSLYIVLSGRLQVIKEVDRQFQVVAEIGRGETVGEMALITEGSRFASIYAIRDCRLIRINKAVISEFFSKFPVMGLNLAKLIIQRLTEKSSKRRKRAIRNVAVLGLHNRILINKVTDDLQSALKQRGKNTRLLSSAYVDGVLGRGIAQTNIENGADNQRLSVWLDNEETTHDLVLYQADSDASEWTQRCIRQADEILLFVDADAPPVLTPLEHDILSGQGRITTAKQTLVLLQSSAEMPSGTASWLAARQVGFHVHIRSGEEARDYGRLSRYLTDSMIGLVLAGGGAKGFAHIGVWRALEEARIPVDYIGATSMGAFVGGSMAFDWKADKIFDICRDIAGSPLKSDFNLLPVVSLFKGKILDRILQRHYLAHDIEDCPIPFFCVSSNLTQAHPVVHRSGNMFHAVRASGALPAVVPPVIDHKGLLIDGGIFNNFPTDVMLEMGVQLVIGVDFLVDQTKKIRYKEIPSNWRVLLSQRLSGSRKRPFPTMLDTIIESTTLHSAYIQKQNSDNTDIYINPDVSRFGMLDWKSYDKIVEKGYEAAKRALENSTERLIAFIV